MLLKVTPQPAPEGSPTSLKVSEQVVHVVPDLNVAVMVVEPFTVAFVPAFAVLPSPTLVSLPLHLLKT